MVKALRFFGIAMLCMIAWGCGGTEIDKNPMPIVWGGISFFPDTVERSRNRTVLNRVSFSGYGKKGTIDRVIITPGQTEVENLKSDFFSSKRQIWKGVTGEYKQALEFVMSDRYMRAYRNSSGNPYPKFKVSSYSGEKDRWTVDDGWVELESSQLEDLSFSGWKNYTGANIVIKEAGKPPVKCAKATLAQLFVPEDADRHPEQIIVKGLHLLDLSVPEYEATAASFDLDYSGDKLKFGLEKVSVPGQALAELGIEKFPKILEGSAQGQGSVSNNIFRGDGNLEVAGLLDLKADMAARVTPAEPESINFVLKDKGILAYMTEEQKGALALLSMAVPNGQAALLGFLAKPGQALAGSVKFSGSRPDFKFRLE